MRSSSIVASLVRRFEVKNEKNPVEQHTSSPRKLDNMKVTVCSPRSVISKSASYVSSDGSDIESPSLSDQLSSDHYGKILIEQRATSPRKSNNTKVIITSPKTVISESPPCISCDSSYVESSFPSDQVASDHYEKSLMEQHATSSHKINNTNKVTTTLPKPVISKSPPCISSDSSDVESSSPSDQVFSDLSLSQEDIWGSPLDPNEEDSKQDIDSFDVTFPSPSFNARSECEFFCQEELDRLILNSSMDEPIFWPFDNESYNTPDLDIFLSVSPRRNLFDVDISVKSGLDPIRVRPEQKSNKFKGISGCERKTVPNPETNVLYTATTAPEIPNMPSRLGKSSNVPKDLTYDMLYPTKGGNLIKPLRNLLLGRLKSFKESSIEKSIGLHEFDGHEGIVGLGADNESPLCGSPWQITSMMKFGTQRIKKEPVKSMV